MPMGGWTKELLTREGYAYLDEWVLSDDPARVAEMSHDDSLWKGYVTRCTSLKEEAESEWAKPNGYPYLQCEGAAVVGKRRCEYCRMRTPVYHAYSVFPYMYGDTSAPTPGPHNDELAKQGVHERIKAIKAGLKERQEAAEKKKKGDADTEKQITATDNDSS
jgi:hypothetical protein